MLPQDITEVAVQQVQDSPVTSFSLKMVPWLVNIVILHALFSTRHRLFRIGGPCTAACALLSGLRSVSGPSTIVSDLDSVQSRASL